MRQYVIWSIEHTAWWRANFNGYTKSVAEAGRYTQEAAEKILHRANAVKVNECMIPVECVA